MSSSLGWTADGIERAEAAGGITLETYRRPGFTGNVGVRRRPGAADAGGPIEVDPDPPDDLELEDRSIRRNP